MRRLTSLLALLGLVLGLTAVAAAPATADITAPAEGATLRGNATLSASGASNGTGCLNGSSPQTTLQLINSAGTAVVDNVQSGTGAKSHTFDTHAFPNGSYTARAIERNRSGLLYCTNSTKTTNRSVRIENVTQLAYSGATEGPQNTSVTVRATLTDPNLSPTALSGRPVSFQLSGAPTKVTATTNSSGVAQTTLSVAGPPRTATITASFDQTTHYQGSTASTTFIVGKNPTTTEVQPPGPVVHGQETRFTATVTPDNGTSTPSGPVQFTVDGADFGDPVPVVDGVATSGTTDSLSTGRHTIGARFVGDDDLLASTADPQTLVVEKAPTSTLLTSTGSPTVTGEPVTFTATVDVVAPGLGQPRGGVQFDVDGEPYGTAVPLENGTADLTVTDLRPGNHQVRATYNGNDDLAASTSAELTHGVDRAETAVTVETSNAGAVAGEPLTFTAHVDVVRPGAGSPSGAVQFAADGQPIGAPVPLTDGTATSQPTGLDAGPHVITADYQGDDAFAGATAQLDQAVASARTTTTVTTSPNPSVVGQPVTARVTVAPVAPARGNPEGAVQLTVDGQPGAFVTLQDGAAEVVLDDLDRGAHAITARYLSADPSFVTSTSDAVTHTVNKAATRTTVTSSAPTAVFGQPVTFTATVTVLAPGAGTPTGTVTFTNGSTVLGSAEVSAATGGQAAITTEDLGVGQHAVVATYDGDDRFQGGTGSVAQRVQRAQTALLVTSSANPSRSGQGVRFTAAVSPVAPGAGEPGGTVRFTVNGAQLGGAVDVVDGEATSAAFTSLSPGVYQVEATYSGDPRFVGSSGSLDQGAGQDVTRGATTMTLASDQPAAAYGDAVTFTVTVAADGPAGGRPSGTVQLWDGGVLLGAVGLSPDGPGTATASFVTTSLSPGDHTVRADYLGSFNFEPATAIAAQHVGEVPSVVGVGSAGPSTFGEDVTFTAVVSGALPAPGRPGGSVTFLEGDTVLGTAEVVPADGARQATLTVPGLAPGPHEVTATYSGGNGFAAATSARFTHLVRRAASALDAEGAVVILGNRYGTVRATLTGLDGAPLAGERLVFTVTDPESGFVLEVCEAPPTGPDGSTTCRSETLLPPFLVDLDGYDVRFEGNDSYLPSTASAPWTVR